MLKNNFLAKSVKFALVAGATTAALTAAPVIAADEEKVERIEVTGSRIKRSDLQGASPVTTITTEDLKVEGNFTVADALRNSNLNSFGSFSERSGSSAQSQATIVPQTTTIASNHIHSISSMNYPQQAHFSRSKP